MKRVAVACALTALAGILLLGSNLQASPEEAAQILEQRCTSCHGLSKVESADYDRAGWERAIDRMILIGARVSSEEKEILIDYLAR